MIVVTDGNANTGFYTPLEGAEKAREYGINVYAVGVGDSVNASQQQVRHIWRRIAWYKAVWTISYTLKAEPTYVKLSSAINGTQHVRRLLIVDHDVLSRPHN